MTALDGGALSLPLKGREIAVFLPLQGGGQEGDGVSVGVVLIAVFHYSIPPSCITPSLTQKVALDELRYDRDHI